MAANDDWFRPLYRRVICLAIAAGAFAAEVIFFGEQLWMFLFGAITAYGAYDFFLSGKYKTPDDKE